jgi:hypothetical protein
MTDGQPDILSSGPRERTLDGARWPGPARRPAVIALVVLLVCCAGALASAVTVVMHQDKTINGLRVRITRQLRSSRNAAPALQVLSGRAFPSRPGGSFTIVTAAGASGAAGQPRTWLYLYGQDTTPGGTYALVGGTCGAGDITSYAWAKGTANRQGNVTLAAPDLSLSPSDPHLWVMVQRLADGATLGGLSGPFVGGRTHGLWSQPPC